MEQSLKELLLKDLCARLPYSTLCYCKWTKDAPNGTSGCIQEVSTYLLDELMIIGDQNYECQICEIKPYLRSMSSMIEEEAKEISILYGFKDILSAKITDGYIDVVVDDGFCNTETRTIWYDEIISSIEIFDWLNAHYFDYRGLIEKSLALEAPADMYNIKEK